MRNENRDNIITLYNEGKSAQEIAEIVSVHISTVYKYIREQQQKKEEEKRKIRESLLFQSLKASERQAKTIIEITDDALLVIQKAFKHAREQDVVNIKDIAMLMNALNKIVLTIDKIVPEIAHDNKEYYQPDFFENE